MSFICVSLCSGAGSSYGTNVYACLRLVLGLKGISGEQQKLPARAIYICLMHWNAGTLSVQARNRKLGSHVGTTGCRPHWNNET